MATFMDQLSPKPFQLTPPKPGPAGIMGPGPAGGNTHLRIRSIANKAKQQGAQQRANLLTMTAQGGSAQPLQSPPPAAAAPLPSRPASSAAVKYGSLLVKHRGLINRFIDRVLAGG